MATYLDKLRQAKATGTPGNFARANTTADIYKQNGNSVYQKDYRGQTMYAPETFQTDRDAAALAAARARNEAMNKTNPYNIVNFGAANGSFGNTTSNTTAPTMSAGFLNANNTNNTNNTTSNNTGVATNNYTYPTSPNTPAQPATSTTSTNQSQLDDAIQKMRDAISQRYEEMNSTARQVSGMNQSNITGNLGRIFGSNVDTSESSPVVAENGRLETNLRQIAQAKNDALSSLDVSVLDKLMQKQKEEQAAAANQRQQEFENAIAQAGLTGLYQGAPTQTAQQNQFLRALQEAGVTGVYNGQQTMDAQTQLLQNALAKAGVTGTYEGQATFPALLQAAGLTGYLNGSPTLGRDQLTLANQQKQINDILDYVASTTNNQNTNSTKLDVANINNTADMEQLLKRLTSNETIAGMNNETKLKQLQINQQRADAYTNRMTQLSNNGGTDSLKQSQALTALIQMNKANSDAVLVGQKPLFSDDQLKLLEQAAGMGKN